MSMYNLLHGVNPMSPALLKMLKLTPKKCGRFRDIYLTEDGANIILYTRNGGGNREFYQEVFNKLSKHPNYIKDYDDDFDCTYAYIVFNVPAKFLPYTKQIAKIQGKPETVHEKFDKTIKEIQNMTPE